MRKTLIALAVAVASAGIAHADPITKSFSIDAVFDPTAPITHVTGDFSLTFDADASAITPGTSTGLVISNFTFPYEGEAKFALGKLSDGARLYTLGNDVSLNFCHLDVSIRSFCATVFEDADGNYQQILFRYTYDGQIYDSIASTDPNPPTGVPEPAVWGMMIGGFALAGVGLRSRRPKVRYA